MTLRPARIFPLGDNAATAEFGTEMSEALNAAAVSLAGYFEKHPFPGFIEALPAIASATIFYRPEEVPKASASQSAFDSVKNLIETAVTADEGRRRTHDKITVPVSFSSVDALDMPTICRHAGLSPEDVIERFLATEYRVYMLGFLPGFAYMGKVDEVLAVPRLATPRTSVPKGSVGIAGRQTGIYPSSSPGGWQIIGRTPIKLFNKAKANALIIKPGDRVQFYEINLKEFARQSKP